MYMQTHRLMGGFMKYPAEMGTGVITCIPSCINTGSGIKKEVNGAGELQVQTA
jgi:hypothetical protein